ncbi:MAG: glutamate-5-semialdehyde dehydrogenase, partial [Planctomycetota bacterium]
MSIIQVAAMAKSASIRLGAVGTEAKNNALAQIAGDLRDRSAEIVSANQKDLAEAEKSKLAAPLLKRLRFDEDKIAGVVAGIESL